MKLPGRVRRVDITERSLAAPGDRDSFLTLHRLGVVNTYRDGKKSARYSYDGVLRRWLDAVALLLIAEIDGRLAICLRSCIRPPLLLRAGLSLPLEDEGIFHTLWELPAGLIEDTDQGLEGLKERAAIEALEETGYQLSGEDFTIMQSAPFVSPGVIPERLYFARAEVRDVSERSEPLGDGSPVEDGGGIWWVGIDEAIAMCERNEIVDLKTELGLRRIVAARVSSQENMR